MSFNSRLSSTRKDPLRHVFSLQANRPVSRTGSKYCCIRRSLIHGEAVHAPVDMTHDRPGALTVSGHAAGRVQPQTHAIQGSYERRDWQ
jgi:hypothetical protein